jgi:enoyl-CoA hydratase/carnithine racemase
VDDENLLESAISYAERAAEFPKGLFAITKKTLHETAAITESVESVELELAPQRWSMQQPAFVNMISRLKARIEKKN